jgi:[ribosomal protein S5]-alanine N-acetyltransferase
MPPFSDTPRLYLLPFSAHYARCALDDRALLASMLGATVPEDWPNPDLADALPYFIDSLTAIPALSTWIALAIEKTDNVLVGSGGFIGLPDETGAVELGFGLVPAFQGRGYATEIARAMLDRAFREPGLRGVIGRCEPANTPSLRLLQRLGFAPDGTDEDGNRLWWLPSPQAKA